MSNTDKAIKSDADTISPEIRSRLQKCFEYGNRKMQQGEHDYATEMFIQCVLGDPGNIIYMQTFIANLRVKYGNNKKGASYGMIKGSGSKGALKTAEVRKKWADVLKSGYEVLKTNPWDESVFMSMGKAALELGYDDSGLALLKHAIEAAPDNIENNRFTARELEDRDQLDQALACWERLLKAKPDDIEAGKEISNLLLKKTIQKVESGGTKKDQEEETEENQDAGSKKFNKEDEFEKRLQKNPEDRGLFLEMAQYFFQKGNLRKTEETYKRALKVFPDDVDFMPALLDIQKMRAREEVERAKKLYQKDPSDELKEKYNALLKDYNAKKLALIQYKIDQNPQNTTAHFEYGDMLLHFKKYKEAIAEFQLARNDVSLRGECLMALAYCFQQIKQYRLAMMHYDQALDSQEGEGELVKRTLYDAARLAFALGDLKKADSYANRLATIDFSYKDLGVLLDNIAKKRDN
ncbi:MAG: tetratricopeptide repeat protein [Planctomycetia bacterium]|nr:tetratricopeptide repeat protein [Planctomycetia bacterium]